MNPNWWRTGFASVLLAIVLQIGLDVPFLSSFVAIAIIYLLHVVQTEMGAGVRTTEKWLKLARNVVMGIVVFLALRFLAAPLIGLTGSYPIDTYEAVRAGKGFKNIFWSKDVSKIILWEITFAMVAGQITVMWVQGTNKFPVRFVIVVSWLLLTAQITWPDVFATWPSKAQINQSLKTNGIMRTIFPKDPPSTNTPPATVATAKPVEALVLMYEGVTPCSTDIQYRAKIRTDGDPLLIKFTGVTDWFPHPGKGAVDGPQGVQAGETKFVSADTNRPNVKVWVYKKTFTTQ